MAEVEVLVGKRPIEQAGECRPAVVVVEDAAHERGRPVPDPRLDCRIEGPVLGLETSLA